MSINAKAISVSELVSLIKNSLPKKYISQRRSRATKNIKWSFIFYLSP